MQYAILPKMVEVLFKYCENVKFNFVDKEVFTISKLV